jgi:hypothetical protein
LGPLSRSIRSIIRRLVTKIIIRMDRNCETNPLSLINSSLEIGYCSMTLSNHVIIRLVRLVSKIKIGVVATAMFSLKFHKNSSHQYSDTN